MKIFNSRFLLRDEADVLNKLSMYLSANLSLSESLVLLEDQVESKRKKQTLALWRTSIEAGKSLTQAFVAEGTMKLSAMSQQTVALGERTGSLADSLKSACTQAQRTLSVKKKISSSLAYPSVILVGTFCLVLGLLLFVFPKITPLFKTLKVTLPLSTRLLIGISDTLSQYYWLVLGLVFFVAIAVVLLSKYSERWRNFIRFTLLRIPFVRSIIRARILCSIFDPLHTLLQGGEQLSDAITVVSKTVQFIEYRALLENASKLVAEGKVLSVFLKENKRYFPIFISGLVSVGERTGNIENSMRDVSEIVQTDLDDRLKLLTSALEPILMVSMSLIIGFIAISIILPIYGITNHFQNV